MTTDERLAALEGQMGELLAAVKTLSSVKPPPPQPWWQLDAGTVLAIGLAGGLLLMYISGRGADVTDAFTGFVTGIVTWWFKSRDERQNQRQVTQALYALPPTNPPST
jgi:hypothetical protein